MQHIANVYHWANGMTMVFDQHGKQMPQFQGRTEDVVGLLEAAGWKSEARRDAVARIESMGVVELSPTELRAVAQTFTALADDLDKALEGKK